ncbi:hypothetical protein [Candidimonas nitroreducens]|uniref:Uncharacterized protein n=1 Tax=Candidimonas nitroreducens TaxID=683354 RepID=A0A225M6U0_9BURK|nr:hypothetical protein [Candidimonas nitroreducens]OWT55281.1 hypothetical protein CEY11_21465 [Candidimonas nitroreducens]
MEKFYIHTDAQGRILYRVSLDEIPGAAMVERGELIESDAHPDTHYVLTGVPALRPTQATKLTGKTLTKLPVPCAIIIDGTTYDCADDHADLEFDAPGSYRVRVVAHPYLDKEFTIENPA